MSDKQTEWTGVDSDVALKDLAPFSSGEKERAWRLAMDVIRDMGEDPGEVVREATETVEFWKRHPYRSHQEELEERIRQLLAANNEELRRRREAENKLENELVVRDALISRVRKLERSHKREPVFAFLAGFCLAWALVESMRWLLS